NTAKDRSTTTLQHYTMLFSKHLVSATALLGVVSCNAFFAGRLSVPKASVSERACQRQRCGALSMGSFEMPHQTKKREKQGFGGGRAKKPPQQGKTFTTGEAVARHMLLEYNAIKAEGGKVARVHARLKGTEDWLPVGNVCTKAGWTAQGVQGQKRLILDHAAEMYSQLRSGAGKKLVLEAGYGPEGEEEGEITLCKGIKYDDERVGVALDPPPEGPYFKGVAKGGFGSDTSSAATLMDKKK
ncbi:unnamed protein product, partial [Pylaiella littoralis]